MKQIVDKLNKIAQAIDESVELPTSDLIIDSLDAITTAFGGTPNDSNLIVDKLDDIAGVAHGGITPTGNIEITENGENINVAPYATATVNVTGGGGGGEIPTLTITLKPAPEASVAELGAIASFNGTNYVKVPYSSISTDTNTEIIDLYYYLGSETTYMQYSAFSDIVTGVITGTYGDFVNCALNDWGDLIITDPTLPSSCSITFTAIGPR